MWSSLAVLVGLGGVAFGYPMGGFGGGDRRRGVRLHCGLAAWPPHHRDADRYGAAGLGRNRIGALPDRVSGVVGVDGVRVRPVGDKLFVEVVVAVSRTLPLDRVKALKDRSPKRSAPRCRAPRSVTHRAPRARRRDRAGARHGDRAQPGPRRASRHRARHRGTASPSRSISRSTASWRSAPPTRSPTSWRRRSARSSGRPSRSTPISSRCSRRRPPAARRRRSGCARSKCAVPRSPPKRMIRDVHDVRVRETDEGEIVNFHGRVDPALAVQAVHEKVDEVERALRRRSPSIKRVIGHAEPRRLKRRRRTKLAHAQWLPRRLEHHGVHAGTSMPRTGSVDSPKRRRLIGRCPPP